MHVTSNVNSFFETKNLSLYMCISIFIFLNYCKICKSQIGEEMALLFSLSFSLSLSLSLFLSLSKEKLYIQNVSIALIDGFSGYLQMLKCSVEWRMMNTNGKFG
jgi:hypothetical protein